MPIAVASGNNDVRTGGIVETASTVACMSGPMDITTEIELVFMTRTEVISMAVSEQLNDVRVRNNMMKDLTAAMAAARSNKPTNDKDTADMGTFVDSKGKSWSVLNFMNAMGIPVAGGVKTDNKYNAAEFDLSISNLKGAVDTLNSTSSMDMIRLQGLNDKYSAMFAAITNELAKHAQTQNAIIANLRG